MRVTVARETSVPVMLTVPTCRWRVVRHVRSMVLPAYATPVSYTHLTLPTKRIV